MRDSMTLKDVWAQAVALAWKDENFKARLLANPTDALRAQFGFPGLLRMNLEVSEAPTTTESDQVGTLTLTLPAKPSDPRAEAALIADYEALTSVDVRVCFC